VAENDGMDLRSPSDIDQLSSTAAGQKLAELKAEYDRANNPAPPAALPAGAPAQTPAQAAARLTQLTANPKFVDEYLAGSASKVREVNELMELAASGDFQPDNLIEVVNAVDNPSALRRSHYEGLLDGLRDNGALPASREKYIRDFDAGRTDFVPSQGDGRAFGAAADRLLRDPTIRDKYLSGDLEVTAKINNLKSIEALAALDGQPISNEGVEILTKLGLR
jgi:hypothetical protein